MRHRIAVLVVCLLALAALGHLSTATASTPPWLVVDQPANLLANPDFEGDFPARHDPYTGVWAGELGVAEGSTSPRLMFMMSSGGLTAADMFQGKDALLSGPAGGVVGMVETARLAGFGKVIGFDMGGTSTDVAHYDGDY